MLYEDRPQRSPEVPRMLDSRLAGVEHIVRLTEKAFHACWAGRSYLENVHGSMTRLERIWHRLSQGLDIPRGASDFGWPLPDAVPVAALQR